MTGQNWTDRVDELLDPWRRTGGPLPIVTAGDPVLRRRADPYNGQLSDATLADLIDAMRVTMHAAPGVGLAAPQIGIGLQIAVIEDPATVDDAVAAARDRTPLPFQVLLNPVYRAQGTRRAVFYEGCLSVPGYQAVVDRPHAVEVEVTDLDGVRRTVEFSGWAARIVQHETDHLAGTLYLDRAILRSLTDSAHYLDGLGAADIGPAREALGF
jgi:peptide deformylase